jgi:hypothetical protein
MMYPDSYNLDLGRRFNTCPLANSARLQHNSEVLPRFNDSAFPVAKGGGG